MELYVKLVFILFFTRFSSYDINVILIIRDLMEIIYNNTTLKINNVYLIR